MQTNVFVPAFLWVVDWFSGSPEGGPSATGVGCDCPQSVAVFSGYIAPRLMGGIFLDTYRVKSYPSPPLLDPMFLMGVDADVDVERPVCVCMAGL